MEKMAHVWIIYIYLLMNMVFFFHGYVSLPEGNQKALFTSLLQKACQDII